MASAKATGKTVTIAQNKARVRAEVRRRVAMMTQAERARASAEATERFLSLPAVARARTLLAYWPLPDEVDVRDLCRRWLESGRRLAGVRADWASRTLEGAWVTDLESGWGPGPRGVRQPVSEAPRAERADIDLVLVPGVAFDESCRRLGRGAGFYDRLLALEDWPAPRVALAFEAQLMDQLPVEEHDRPVDAVVTESRVRVRVGGRLADAGPSV